MSRQQCINFCMSANLSTNVALYLPSFYQNESLYIPEFCKTSDIQTVELKPRLAPFYINSSMMEVCSWNSRRDGISPTVTSYMNDKKSVCVFSNGVMFEINKSNNEINIIYCIYSRFSKEGDCDKNRINGYVLRDSMVVINSSYFDNIMSTKTKNYVKKIMDFSNVSFANSRINSVILKNLNNFVVPKIRFVNIEINKIKNSFDKYGEYNGKYKSNDSFVSFESHKRVLNLIQESISDTENDCFDFEDITDNAEELGIEFYDVFRNFDYKSERNFKMTSRLDRIDVCPSDFVIADFRVTNVGAQETNDWSEKI